MWVLRFALESPVLLPPYTSGSPYCSKNILQTLQEGKEGLSWLMVPEDVVIMVEKAWRQLHSRSREAESAHLCSLCLSSCSGTHTADVGCCAVCSDTHSCCCVVVLLLAVVPCKNMQFSAVKYLRVVPPVPPPGFSRTFSYPKQKLCSLRTDCFGP